MSVANAECCNQRRPCDACRRRKICCVKESDAEPCSLCQMRSQQCTYMSRPAVRRRRETSKNSVLSDSSSIIAGSTTWGKSDGSSLLTRPESQSDTHISEERPHSTSLSYSVFEVTTTRSTEATPPEQWVPQFIGLSGDQDPYVLRHCQFRGNRYKRHEWACIRVVGEGNADPTHFTV